MISSSSDVEWMKNLRKSVANLFNIDQIRSNSMGSSLTFSPSYTINEVTLFGNCSSDYTHMKLSSQDLYKVKRSINFDKCSEKVDFKVCEILTLQCFLIKIFFVACWNQ